MPALKVMPELGFDRHTARKLRRARSESIEQAAVRMGIGYWTLAHVEAGRAPSLNLLLILAEGYGVEPGDLLCRRQDAA